MAKEFKLSPERWKELKDELVYLKTVREKEVADQIKEARSFGDLSENSEYDEAKNEQGKLYSRIAEVENILDNCVVIEEEVHDGKTVRLGSKLKVLDVEFNEELEKLIEKVQLEDLEARISTAPEAVIRRIEQQRGEALDEGGIRRVKRMLARGVTADEIVEAFVA